MNQGGGDRPPYGPGWPPQPGAHPGAPHGGAPQGGYPVPPQATVPMGHPQQQPPYPQQPQPPYAQPSYPQAQYPAAQYPQYPQAPYAAPYAPAPMIVVQNQIPYPAAMMHPDARKKDTALLLAAIALFFGIFGLHRFYLRQPGLGILYLLTFGLCGIGQLIDVIQLATMSQQEFDARYNAMR